MPEPKEKSPATGTSTALVCTPKSSVAPLVETRCGGTSLEKVDSLRALILVTSADLERVDGSIGKLASQLKAIKCRNTINGQIQALEDEMKQVAEAIISRKNALKAPFNAISSKRARTKNKLWAMVVTNPRSDIVSLTRQLTDDLAVISDVLDDLKDEYTNMLAHGNSSCRLDYGNHSESWKGTDLLKKIEEIEKFLASKEVSHVVRINGETYEHVLSQDKDHSELVARHAELQKKLSGMRAEQKMAEELLAEYQSATTKGKTRPDKAQEPQGERAYSAITNFIGTAAAGVGIVMAAAQSFSIGAGLILAGAAFVGANRLLRKGDKALKTPVHSDTEDAEIAHSLEFDLDVLTEERKTLLARQERLVLALAETEKPGHESQK